MTTGEHIIIMLTARVRPEFQVEDAGGRSPDDKGCLTLIIQTTENDIHIAFDGHHTRPLTELGEAITKAGGIIATGKLGIGRSIFGGQLAECGHYLEASTIDPWNPGES